MRGGGAEGLAVDAGEGGGEEAVGAPPAVAGVGGVEGLGAHGEEAPLGGVIVEVGQGGRPGAGGQLGPEVEAQVEVPVAAPEGLHLVQALQVVPGVGEVVFPVPVLVVRAPEDEVVLVDAVCEAHQLLPGGEGFRRGGTGGEEGVQVARGVEGGQVRGGGELGRVVAGEGGLDADVKGHPAQLAGGALGGRGGGGQGPHQGRLGLCGEAGEGGTRLLRRLAGVRGSAEAGGGGLLGAGEHGHVAGGDLQVEVEQAPHVLLRPVAEDAGGGGVAGGEEGQDAGRRLEGPLQVRGGLPPEPGGPLPAPDVRAGVAVVAEASEEEVPGPVALLLPAVVAQGGVGEDRPGPAAVAEPLVGEGGADLEPGGPGEGAAGGEAAHPLRISPQQEAIGAQVPQLEEEVVGAGPGPVSLGDSLKCFRGSRRSAAGRRRSGAARSGRLPGAGWRGRGAPGARSRTWC